jgi:rhodanese-related sulfurtransferase
MGSDYTCRQVADLAVQGEVQVIDVREPYEHEAGHITGSILIPLRELPARVREIDAGRPVILYCRSGGRSAMASEALARAGDDAHNMEGGLLAWQAEALPLEPADGFVADA